MKTIYLFAFLLSVFQWWGCGESHTQNMPLAAHLPDFEEQPPLDPQLQQLLDDYDGYFRDSMILTLTPGAAVVIVKDGEVIFLKGYGTKEEGKFDPVDVHTVFRIGSLSKGFAGLLTGILVENGNLIWNENVQEHIPEFNLKDPNQARRIEIRHLLSHTNGLPYQAFSNLIEQGFDLNSVIRFFPTTKLAGKEGEFFGYQNAAFSLIEPVIQSVTGQTYQALLAEKIFTPADMADASCDFESMRNIGNKALPHHFTESGWVVDTVTRKYYDFAAAGGVNASISDMGKWLKVLLGHKPDVVSSATLDEVFRPVINTGLERAILPGFIHRDSAFYAMGWRVLLHGPDTLIYHAGFVNNYHSEIALNRKDGIGICVLLNAPSPLAGRCIPAFFRRWEKYRQEHTTEISMVIRWKSRKTIKQHLFSGRPAS